MLVCYNFDIKLRIVHLIGFPLSLCRPRESGDPEQQRPDPRFRGDDKEYSFF